jgi:hypothetical protein
MCLLLYVAMIVAGATILIDFVGLGGHSLLRYPKAGGFFFAFGAYLLWVDFLSPNRDSA